MKMLLKLGLVAGLAYWLFQMGGMKIVSTSFQKLSNANKSERSKEAVGVRKAVLRNEGLTDMVINSD